MSPLQSFALTCIHLWNSAFDQPEALATSTFENATLQKRLLAQEVSLLWPAKSNTREEEAELLIGLLLSAVMVPVPNTQLLLDRTCRLLSQLHDSPLKARLLIALYTYTEDEDDRSEALRILNECGDEEARKLFGEIDLFMVCML